MYEILLDKGIALEFENALFVIFDDFNPVLNL